MAPNRPPRAETGTIAGVLANLRRAPKRVRRQSREVIENAVSQLFDAAVRYPHGALGSGEYRIEDLARLAGTTTRNIDRKSTRLNSSHERRSRMPSSA